VIAEKKRVADKTADKKSKARVARGYQVIDFKLEPPFGLEPQTC